MYNDYMYMYMYNDYMYNDYMYNDYMYNDYMYMYMYTYGDTCLYIQTFVRYIKHSNIIHNI